MVRPGSESSLMDPSCRSTTMRRAVASPSPVPPLARLRDELESAFAEHATPNATEPRLPHVSNLSFTGVNGDELVAALDLLGVQISSGSACAAGTAEPSPVITAMLGRERARSAVRISLGEDTTAEAIAAAKSLVFQALGANGPEGSRSA